MEKKQIFLAIVVCMFATASGIALVIALNAFLTFITSESQSRRSVDNGSEIAAAYRFYQIENAGAEPTSIQLDLIDQRHLIPFTDRREKDYLKWQINPNRTLTMPSDRVDVCKKVNSISGIEHDDIPSCSSSSLEPGYVFYCCSSK